MEQVFDFREFVIKAFKKFKSALILALIFAILGGIVGVIKSKQPDVYKNVASASVSFSDNSQDATALTNATKNINDVITYDSFYYGILQELSYNFTVEELQTLFDGVKTPKISKMQEIINVYMKGSVVFISVTCDEPELCEKASKICIDYSIKEIPNFFEGTSVKFLQQQKLNVSNQNNPSKPKTIIKYSVLGLGGGFVLAILFIFFVDVLDLRVKSKEDLLKYGLPILGEVNKN